MFAPLAVFEPWSSASRFAAESINRFAHSASLRAISAITRRCNADSALASESVPFAVVKLRAFSNSNRACGSSCFHNTDASRAISKAFERTLRRARIFSPNRCT